MKEVRELINAIDNLKHSNLTHIGISNALVPLEKELRRYIELKNNKQKNFSVFEKVQIGVGENYLKGFINIDYVEPADILCDVREGIPLNDNSVEMIFSEHFFEHLDYPYSAMKFLSESYKVLKTGGEIVIGVPDSEVAIKMYTTKDKNTFNFYKDNWYKNRKIKNSLNTYIDVLNIHFRDELFSEKYSPHFWAYDFDKLKNMLENCGFAEIKLWEIDDKIANPERVKFTLYISAIKK